MLKSYLEVGQIVSTQGIKGQMRVQPWSDAPTFLEQFSVFYLDNQGKEVLAVESAKAHGNMVLLKVKGIDNIDDTSPLLKRTLYIHRDDANLDEGSYFIQDLMDCKVLDIDDKDKVYGKITDILQTGANDIWEITNAQGKAFLLPVLPHVVLETNVEEGYCYIRPLKGIFDDEN